MPGPGSSNRPNVIIHGGNRLNFISSWFFLWIFQLLNISRKRNLGKDDLTLQDSETAKVVGDRLENFWRLEGDNTENRNGKNSIRRALVKSFGTYYAFLGLYKLFGAFFTFLGAYFLVNRLIDYASGNGNTLAAYLYALGLFLCALFSSIFINQLIAESTRVGVQVRAALMVLIYRKSLRLSSDRGGTGDIINLVANDCNRVAEACVNFHFLWSSAVEIIAVLILACVELGTAGLPALFILLVLFPIQYKLGRLTSTISNTITNITSSRIHLMSEILTAIKLIKFYAWESYFRERVGRVRRKEFSRLLNGIVVKVWTFCVVFGAPVLAMLGCLCVKVLSPDYNNEYEGIRARKVFTVLALFYTVRYPLIMLPIAVRTTLGALDSFERLNEFLLQTELEPLKQEKEPIENDPSIRIYMNDADFSYEGVSDPTLRFLNMKVRQGELIAIVGDVGAGKSSVLSAILGQIRKDNGICKIRGSISYVPHDAWLLNSTLKDNILFGNDYDDKRYQDAVHICALNRDFSLLSYGDMTEIGDRGVNLSLGQRQRVSVARAVYSNADIILLDDPLSVMDPVVGKHIFHECIRKYLKDKAVIFVTNQLQYLSECDRIMVMKDGECFEEGTYDELITKDVNLASLIGEYMEIEDPDQIDELINEIRLEKVAEEIDESDGLESLVVADSKNNSNLKEYPLSFTRTQSKSEAHEATINRIVELNSHTIQNANINEQTISKMIERNNLTILGGAGKTRMMGTQVNRELNVTAKAVERNQLTIHSLNEREGITPIIDSDRRKEPKVSLHVYLDYFRKSTGFSLTLLMIISFFLMAAVRFFSDWWLINLVISINPEQYGSRLGIYGALVGIVLIGVFARGGFYAWVMMHKSQALHDQTFMKVMRAPMSYFDITPLGKILNVFAKHQYLVDDVLSDNALQFFSWLPLITGTVIFIIILFPWTGIAAVVLSFCIWFLIYVSKDVEERFKHMDADSKAPIFSHLSATLEGLASIRVYNAQNRFDDQNIEKINTNNKALFAMMQVKSWQSLYIDLLASVFIFATALCVIILRKDGGPEYASKAGLAIANALQLLIFVQWMVRSGRDVAATMDSVQQLLYYRQNIPSERPNVIETNRPPPDWGKSGEIEFKNVTLRYNIYGVAVLKSISFHIHPREKIGIVGKTGSGKTTLLVSLLRIVELAEGNIIIDNLDISTIGLRDLRNNIAIIPQEPVIFAGTIRSNLDPFRKCTDEEIWNALKAVHLYDKVKSSTSRLDTQVLENGRNFSLGQRQLFCIARALLKKTNILVLDEATSAVDLQTDVIIQETIKKNFADHTVLTIAHRLNTIMEADRILCLNEGRVVEFDTPLNLLNNPEGFFYQLVDHSGPEVATKLKQIALQHAPSNNITIPDISNSNTISKEHEKSTIISPTISADSQHNNNQHSHMPPSLGEVFVQPPSPSTSQQKD
ncbi:P-loop containing nucleoside triphosphate hydrolase protein [Rhizophagus irregularis DAOM 181602=DAOM 197198]|uniref:Bile acid-transporting ATPase YBT1 n=2 Tax=Rhizophagus irregularis TaxID=588596 RepID=A0A015K752_RHIIW|nr:P-loop containing nucleoside triphosphate hydrolase protein [Rhizophagus irregularis DAOM 181602=DAOM 197198]EXX63324.1 bile acid-transporting ATPase YBT1 [Rhizophagus irregularis DAOM 197198w]POG70126.1 P-loop containing nucleoside triphosphate hydrolase protein [Rhizophagus irregularis DAOM 181602=DAOM 197198]|eukprot:XP_025176992.1 P-loop containing nucleoside triphosphate hydrolase protein [Rhizophagus irregularis DAOM 181602=DAOM 197198]